MKKESENTNILKVVGLAVGLPSSILGVFALGYYLVKEDIISSLMALFFLIVVIIYTFVMMIRYANKK